MELSTPALSFLLAGLGFLLAVSAVVFLRTLRENSDRAMASFQLHPDRTVSEFRLLYYGILMEMTAFVIYSVGGFLDLAVLLNVGRVISSVFLGTGVYLSLNWWRRFR